MTPLGLETLAAGLAGGEISFDSYLEALERRTEEREPQVQALIPEPGRFERLRRDARALEARFPDRRARPALFGIPVGIKDIFRADGFATGAGSRLPHETFAGSQSKAVTRLVEAGALILGKTVSTEFAYFAPGATTNPHDVTRTPGGSSSGSAAAVAAGECPLTLGTQTIGSISRPASYCGVVGYKPSYDRISRDGVIPLSRSLDHVGPFAREVAGVRTAAAILCDEWQAVGESAQPRLGVPVGTYLEQAEESGQALFAGICERLSEAGYEIVHVDAFPEFETLVARHEALVAAEAAEVHGDWLERFGELYHSRTVALIERGREVSETELAAARAGRQALRRELMVLMAERGIDLWISPAARGVAPLGLDSTGSPVMNLPWTHAGLPTVSVPAAVNAEGLPFGLQIAGSYWRDELLLEQAEGLASVLQPAGRLDES